MPVGMVVVLGAGRPHRGLIPAALRTDRQGIPVLDWLINATNASLSQVAFLGGYDAELIQQAYPGLRVIIREGWESEGSAASLLGAPLESEGDVLVVYGDILIRPELVQSAMQQSGDATVAWDSRWRSRYAGRRRSDLARREKVLVADGVVERCGPSIDVEEASGEFIGLLRLTPKATARLKSRRDELLDALRPTAHLSELVEILRAIGMTVNAVDAVGDWAEIDDPSDIARFVLGTKADTLRRLGRLVKRSQVADQVTRTVAEWEADPEAIVGEVSATFGDRRLIVRSSSTHEDAFTCSNAGRFTSVLDVGATDRLEVAVAAVAASYRRAGIDAESQQILVQPLIEDVVFSGVALTRTLDGGAPWFVVEYADGSDTEQVTSGGADGTRCLYVHREAIDASCREGCSAAGALEQLSPVLEAINEVESLLGHDGLDVEFAVDRKGVVHLLQVRPTVATTAIRRDDDAFGDAVRSAQSTWDAHASSPPHLPGEGRLVLGIMPDWNPAEIIGTAPGRLALDLYRRLVTDEVWAQQRAEVGYRDVRPAPLLVDVAGRPYVDVRASFASFLPAQLDDGLAGRLLAAGLERLVDRPWLHDKVEFEVMPTCVDPDWSRWERILSADGFPSGETELLKGALTEVTSTILRRVDADLATVGRLRTATRGALEGVHDPLERAAILLEHAGSLGTLPFAHLARAAFVAISMLEGARAQGVLGESALAGFHATVKTVSGELADDAAAVSESRLAWDAFVGRWGHLRPGTYEIVSPRYDMDPERFLRPLVTIPRAESAAEPEALREAWDSVRPVFVASVNDLSLKLDAGDMTSVLRRAIEGRESAKHAFTRNVSAALEAIAQGWERRGLERDILSDAPLDLLLPSPEGRVPEAGLVRDAAIQAKERRLLAERMPLPALITTRGDIDVFLTAHDSPNFVGTRPIIAPTTVLEESAANTPDLSGRVVIIPRADPGFDWIFGHRIAGLITLYGGANSHMSIRAAEHGLPAAIGVGELRYRELAAALEVEIDPRGRILRALR